MSYGPNPWLQTQWDARAAGNFIGGGAGCGLLVFAALWQAQGSLQIVLLSVAMSLVALGLLSVLVEIGRPWRALNVILNPRSSWMSREAALAPLLFGSAVLSLLGIAAALPVAGLLALGYLYCQARMLQAAKGIPAWREPLTVPLLIATGLCEGAALYWLLAPWWGQGSRSAWLGFGVLLLLRFVFGVMWRQRLARSLQQRPLRAVNRAGHVFSAGCLLPLAIVLVVLAAPLPAGWQVVMQVLAGAFAFLGGAAFKFLLVTRAGFNQGFALQHLPVRGVHR